MEKVVVNTSTKGSNAKKKLQNLILKYYNIKNKN
jgi:hypothetical protein